jgi:hypothetical protein
VFVPDASDPAAALVTGLPAELPPMELQSASPSGARGLGFGAWFALHFTGV